MLAACITAHDDNFRITSSSTGLSASIEDAFTVVNTRRVTELGLGKSRETRAQSFDTHTIADVDIRTMRPETLRQKCKQRKPDLDDFTLSIYG